MHHNIRIIPFLLFLLFSFEIYGQSENSFNPKIIPPSPTAYELGRYGQTDVGTFTGTPNISVPLYTYKTRNLSIPVSLGYNSNGIQVDQMETNVGLGWNLNAGGIINRVVRGKPDEERSTPINEDDCFSSSFISYMDANQFLDTEPDLYSYNFNGHSGQFVFDKNGKAVLVPQNSLKIERVEIDLKKGFKITTDDGVEYYFFDKEYSTWENTDAPSSVLTGWYLSKVIHPAGDIINFTYKDTNYSFTSNISRSLPVKMSESNCPTNNNPNVNLWEQTSVNILSVMGKMIESISSTEPAFGILSFQHISNPNMIGNFLIKGYQVTDHNQNNIENTVFNYLFPANQRIFLSECIFKDTSKKYSFEYEDPEGLAARLSDGKDLWGFSNGKSGTYPDPAIYKDLYLSNSLIINAVKKMSFGDKRAYIDFAKKGILKKIIYPTKGSNEFTYESNTVIGTITSPLEIANGNIKLYNHGDDSAELNDSFQFENKKTYEGEIEASIISDGYNSGNDTFPEGDVFIKVLVENLTNPGENMIFYTTAYNKPNTKTYEFLANTTYKISVAYTPGIKTTARVNFSYCTGGGIESTGNIPVGGLRIREIKTFDTDLNKTDVKYYYYGKKETPNVSSGVEGVKMYLLNSTSINRACADGSASPSPFYVIATTNVMTVHPNSIYQLYRSNGNSSTTYQNVTVSHGGANYENGGEEFYYHTSSDTKPISCINNHLNSAPWTNTSWDNGVLVKKIIFNKKLIPLNQIVYKYKLENQYTQEVVGIAYDFKFNPMFFYTRPDPRTIEHLNINKYSTNSYWFYVDSEENTQYDLEGLNPVTTKKEYKYNNPLHKKLSSETTTTSTGEEIETKYFYPQDPEMATEPLRNELIAKNMIGVVLDTQTLRAGTKLSEQKTIYDQSSATSNLLLPRSIGVNKGVNAIDLSLDNKITYDQYDEKGNILQYTLESGIPVSIIWGYNKMQPIAKIENLAYNLIPSGTIANLQTLSNADNDNCMSGSCTEQLLRNGLNAFRNSLPNAFISTYTYNPLVGVTSVTDPKGISSYYEYNTYGRLKFVKDKDLNVLQKYCYNYKGQQVDCSDNDSTSVILYKSSARSGSFTKNNCSSGGVGATVVYSQAEGASTSTISQADADSKGLTKFNTDGQANANANGICTFSSIARSGSFTKNNCASGGVGSSVAYNQAVGVVTSIVSQADADSKGLTKFNTDGQANANANGICTFSSIARSGSFTKNNCASGGVGSSVAFNQAVGVVTSIVSQADADSKGLTKFNTDGQANANTNGTCTFWNAAKSGSIARNNCAAGGTPETVIYNVPSGRYSSTISQLDADAQAQSEINANVQTFANANGRCTFWNTFKSGSIARNNCAAGGTPETVTYTVPAGRYFSYDSQALADAQAQSEINANVQTFANANGKCTFWNAAKSASITRNNCEEGGTPEAVTYTVPAGRYFSYDSQALADSQAQTEINNNGQAYANANAKCTFWNNVKRVSFTRNNCESGGVPEIVKYTVVPGKYSSTISQLDADSQAQNDSDNNGQAYANANGKCTFSSIAINGSFTKNNCPSGTTGSNVSYSQAAGVITSIISQADANANGTAKFYADGQAYANANGICNAAVITNACTLNFNRVSGSSVMYKNGSVYLTANRSGSYDGVLGTGDNFYVVVNASTAYYKSITITSSVRGTLFVYGPNKIGTSATSATFTKVGSEVITIDCIATDMLD